MARSRRRSTRIRPTLCEIGRYCEAAGEGRSRSRRVSCLAEVRSPRESPKGSSAGKPRGGDRARPRLKPSGLACQRFRGRRQRGRLVARSGLRNRNGLPPNGVGAFVSVDGGRNWSAASGGLTALSIRSLEASPDGESIPAAAREGGVVRTPVSELIPRNWASRRSNRRATPGSGAYRGTVRGVRRASIRASRCSAKRCVSWSFRGRGRLVRCARHQLSAIGIPGGTAT